MEPQHNTSVALPRTDMQDGSKRQDKILQGIQITLRQEMVDGMRKHVKSGKTMQLSYTKDLSLSYGSGTKLFKMTPTSFVQEIYQKKTLESNTFVFQAITTHSATMHQIVGQVDDGLEKLKQAMSEANKSREENQATFLSGVPNLASKTLTQNHVKSKRHPITSTTGKTSSATPAQTLNPSKPIHNSASSTQEMLAHMEGQKKALIHILALSDKTIGTLSEKTRVRAANLKKILPNIADQITPDLGKDTRWRLRDRWYKSVFPWKYYRAVVHRQGAIENAIKAFDRMRLATDDPAWRQLQSEDQRAKGTVLSKLHVRGSSTNDAKLSLPTAPTGNHRAMLANAGGVEMARSKSAESSQGRSTNNLANKLMGKKKVATPVQKATKKVEKMEKSEKSEKEKEKEKDRLTTAPVAIKRKAEQPLSQEYIVNSDEELAGEADGKKLEKAAAARSPATTKRIKTTDGSARPAASPAPYKGTARLPPGKPNDNPKHKAQSSTTNSSISSWDARSPKSTPMHTQLSSASSVSSVSANEKPGSQNLKRAAPQNDDEHKKERETKRLKERYEEALTGYLEIRVAAEQMSPVPDSTMAMVWAKADEVVALEKQLTLLGARSDDFVGKVAAGFAGKEFLERKLRALEKGRENNAAAEIAALKLHFRHA